MMSLVLDQAYPATAAQCDRPLQQSCLAHHFTHVKARKRAVLLCKQGRPIAALSLLYACATTDSRVKQFHVWSRARVKDYPTVSATGADAKQLRADILQLRERVTAGVVNEVRDDVFRMVVKRYCRKVGTTQQLAALRRSLGSQQDPDAAPIWNAVASTLDDELARRVLVGPLKEIHAHLLPPANDPQALDRAFMHLAVGLQRIGDRDVAHRSLVLALHHLTDFDAKTLARQVFDGAASGTVAGRTRLLHILASTPAMGAHEQPVSRDLADRRAALMDVLQGALREHLAGRLDYFVQSTAQLIRHRIDRGESAQAAYETGAASLGRTLRTLRYGEISDDFAPEHLVPRLMPRVLAKKEAAVTSEFLCALNEETFTHVRHLSIDGARATWPVLQAACDSRLSRHRDEASKALYELQRRADAGDRGTAAVQIVKVAESLAALREKMKRLGMELGTEERQRFEQRLGRACQVFLHADNPEGALDQTSVVALSDDEIRNLRIAGRDLAPFGLSLSEPALEKEALVRSARHGETGARALETFASAICDSRLSRHRDEASKALYELQSRADAGDRGAAAVQTVTVAKSLAALCEKMERLGMDLGTDERQGFEQRLGRACQVFRHADNPEGALDQASIVALSDDEIRNLRIASRYLAPFGLSLSERALEQEAVLRSARHRETGIRALGDFVSTIAKSPKDIESAVHALRGTVESGKAALQTMLAFMDIGTDEIVKMTEDWARQAVQAVASADAGWFASPGMTISTCEVLRQGLGDVFDALTDISSSADDPDAPAILPVRNISEMMVLARFLVMSVEAKLSASAMREQTAPIGDPNAASVWSPALRSAIAGEFGVDYKAGFGRDFYAGSLSGTRSRSSFGSASGFAAGSRSSSSIGSDSGFAAASRSSSSIGSDSSFAAGSRSSIGSDLDFDSGSDVASLLLAPHQYRHLITGLAEPIALHPDRTEQVATPQGYISVGKQFLRDIKGSLTLSASGVSANGRRVLHTATIPDEDDPVAAVKPVLGALHQLVGEPAEQVSKHTDAMDRRIAVILEYATQTALAGWFKMTAAAGSDGPYKLAGGRASPVGGGADINADVTRCADGRYLLRMSARVSPTENVVVYGSDGTIDGMQVDPSRTFYAITYGLALSFDESGGHTIEIVIPPTLRYRIAELTPAQAAAL